MIALTHLMKPVVPCIRHDHNIELWWWDLNKMRPESKVTTKEESEEIREHHNLTWLCQEVLNGPTRFLWQFSFMSPGEKSVWGLEGASSLAQEDSGTSWVSQWCSENILHWEQLHKQWPRWTAHLVRQYSLGKSNRKRKDMPREDRNYRIQNQREETEEGKDVTIVMAWKMLSSPEGEFVGSPVGEWKPGEAPSPVYVPEQKNRWAQHGEPHLCQTKVR